VSDFSRHNTESQMDTIVTITMRQCTYGIIFHKTQDEGNANINLMKTNRLLSQTHDKNTPDRR
jgi:hypothetical protein